MWSALSNEEDYLAVELPAIPFPNAEGLYQDDAYNKDDLAVIYL